MRILHLSSLYPPAALGGAERVVALLAEAQAADGHEVFACSLTARPQAPGDRGGVTTVPLRHRNPLWIEDSPRFPAPIRFANKTATVFNILTAHDFAALLDRLRPDVLHTHSMVELPPAMWAGAARRRVPIVHTLHDYDLLCIRAALFKDGRRCQPRHLACRILSAPKQAQHHRIDVVAAVGGGVLDRHLAAGLFAHLPPERRHVVWNPVASPARPLRAPVAGDHRFGFLGRLVMQKGVGLLLEACRRLPATGWSLAIAGTGADEARFRCLADGLPVTFLGYQDAPTFLANVDTIVTVPIWDEPFGLTTLEAYAAGARVIGARVGVIGDMVESVDPGWSVPPEDAGALADAMLRAMRATDRLSHEHVQSLLAQVAPEAVARRYVLLYEQARAAVASPA